MKSIDEILFAISCQEGKCGDCAYYYDEDCAESIKKDAEKLIHSLLDENKALHTEITASHGGYWGNICELNAKQETKGKSKYGVSLEDNTTLTRKQRIEHLEEELIDGLKYCEHLKAIDDDGITANDYQRAAMRTAGDDKESYLLNGVMGLCGESGEVIDLVKKHLHQGHELDKEALILECGDCAWYLALIMSAIDCKMGDMLVKNIRKLEERYPAGFDKARSIHREENNG